MPDPKHSPPAPSTRVLMERARRERSAYMGDVFLALFRALLAFCASLLAPPRPAMRVRPAPVLRVVTAHGRARHRHR